jgi:signal transduction histidine kinase
VLYELGLVATIAICGWIALDLLTSKGWQRRALAVACLAAFGAVWAAGDLLVRAASDEAERLFALRLNYLGVAVVPLSLLAVAAQAARPRWWRKAPWVLGAGALLPFFGFSCLFWDGGHLFVDFSVRPPRRGPVFYANMVYSFAIVGLAGFYFVQTSLRLRRANSLRLGMLAIGVLSPLVANFIHIVVLPAAPDPTPVVMGLGALCIRLAVIDSGLALYLPLARADVLEQVEVGILVADLEGRVVDANRAARALVRHPSPVGQPLRELVEAASQRTDVAIEARSVPLRSAVAEVGSAALLEDRSEARQAEQRLQLAARLEALGFLTAGIAHEVNNPLAFIRANLAQLEKLAHELADPLASAALPDDLRERAEETSELVADTQEGVERITALVTRLKSFARGDTQGSGQRRPVDLGRVADAAIAMASVGLPPGAIRRIDRAAPPVGAVEGDLVQIALNLLVNAVQASSAGLDIEVEVGPEEGGASLRVRDRGVGIDADSWPHLFDPFFTTKPPGTGTGLGLSLSYDLARRNGGRLEASNRDGGGAEFVLWLPRDDGEAAARSPG